MLFLAATHRTSFDHSLTPWPNDKQGAGYYCRRAIQGFSWWGEAYAPSAPAIGLTVVRGAGPEATPVASGTATATLILLLYLPLTPFAAHRFVELNVSLRRRIYWCFDASVDGLVPPDGRNFIATTSTLRCAGNLDITTLLLLWKQEHAPHP